MGTAYQIVDQRQAHFLTFQVVGWVDIFTRQIYRDLFIDSMKYCRDTKGLQILAYVIMSNHVHCILQSKTGQLSNTVRDLKRYTSRNILKQALDNPSESRRKWLELVFKYHATLNKRSKTLQLWTHQNHAVELDTNYMMDSRLNYIHQNPVKAGWVEKAEDYLYSSARNYSGLPALIEIDME